MDDFDVVLQHWGALAADYPTYGGLILTRFIMEYPDSISLFPKFAGIAQEELEGHALVNDLGDKLMKKLEDLVKAKGDHAAIVKPLASSHAKNNIPIGHYGLISEILVKVMVEKVGLDEAAQKALRNVLGAVVNDIGVCYKEMGVTI